MLTGGHTHATEPARRLAALSSTSAWVCGGRRACRATAARRRLPPWPLLPAFLPPPPDACPSPWWPPANVGGEALAAGAQFVRVTDQHHAMSSHTLAPCSIWTRRVRCSQTCMNSAGYTKACAAHRCFLGSGGIYVHRVFSGGRIRARTRAGPARTSIRCSSCPAFSCWLLRSSVALFADNHADDMFAGLISQTSCTGTLMSPHRNSSTLPRHDRGRSQSWAFQLQGRPQVTYRNVSVRSIRDGSCPQMATHLHLAHSLADEVVLEAAPKQT